MTGSSCIEPLANLRDLGGLAVDSGTIRHRELWRSDDLSLSAEPELMWLFDQGLRVVLDFRSPTERQRTPVVDHEVSPLTHHALSFFDMEADPEALVARLAEITTAEAMGRWYATLALEAAAVIVAGLETVAAADGAVLFHCSAGKDRTGIFAAAVLKVLGCADEIVIEDYARTDANIVAVLDRLARASDQDRERLGDTVDLDSPLLRAPAAAMATMLRQLDEHHGGFDALLRGRGLTDGTVERLRTRLIE
jgi:protein-tyrosine phosphatase